MEPEEPLCGNFGEEGKEESVISSMSEWEDADLGDFFFPNACLKELRNWIDKTVSLAGAAANTQAYAKQGHADQRAISSPTFSSHYEKGSQQLSPISALGEEELSGVDSSKDWPCR